MPSDFRRALQYHAGMLADEVRVAQFARAVASTVRPDDVVADVGCGTGILALLCCRAGARRVYAVEAGAVGGLAERVIAANGLSDRITVVKGLSTEVQLPEAVDVIVSETIGNAAFDEGILTSLIDARDRFLSPHGRLIPRSVALMIAPIRDDQNHDRLIGIWKRPLAGLDFSVLSAHAVHQLHSIVIGQQHLLAAPRPIIEASLDTIDRPFVDGQVEFELTADGPIAGFGMWFKADLGSEISLSNVPPSRVPSWSSGFLGLPEVWRASCGDRVKVEMGTYDGRTWRWRGSVGGRRFDLNTLAARATNHESLKGDRRRPVLRLRSRRMARAFAQFDGRRTIEEIARSLCSQPELEFPSEVAAKLFVSSLLEQEGI